MAKGKKFYVVWQGRKTGVFSSWADCKAQVEGYEGARYKSFKTKISAEEAFRGNSRDFMGNEVKESTLSPTEIKKAGTPVWNSLSVDAACSGNPGVLEYRGVDTQTREEFFHQGPFPLGTVNLGEFLAIVHGLAYLQNKNSQQIIYSDSRTAMAWVRNKKIKTTLKRSSKNAHLFELVDRAVKWLENNAYQNPILKWETKAWGEIPADFGRK